MRDVIFTKDSVADSLTQAFKKIKKAGYHHYILLGVGEGGKCVSIDLSRHGDFEDTLSCKVSNRGVAISDSSKIKNKNILICEDIVNTGKTVKKIIAELKRFRAKDIKIFSLLMKRNSSIVPNIFIFEIEKDTRVYFPWNAYPIRDYQKGIVRKIFNEDCNKGFECVDPRINENPLVSYYKNQQHIGAKFYLVEDNDEICAIIQFYERDVNKYSGLFLDVIATAKGKEGQKYASTLLKLVTLYMIYHEFDFIYCYAFDKKELIKMYKEKGYDVIGRIEDNHFGVLHKMIVVNEKNDKKEVIGAIRKSI